MRGGSNGPNYDAESVENAITILNKSNVVSKLVIDCSHANSKKQFDLQPAVFQDVVTQRTAGNQNIVGAMLESHLKSGNQTLHESNPDSLTYGISITDACLGWKDTEKTLLEAYDKLTET